MIIARIISGQFSYQPYCCLSVCLNLLGTKLNIKRESINENANLVDKEGKTNFIPNKANK